MHIAILLYKGFTALDAVGPYEILGGLPGAKINFVAEEPGTIETDGALSVIADAAFADVPKPNIIVVPGGFGTFPAMQNQPLLEWVKTAHQTSDYTMSVCTGSLILAAAGLLAGARATGHWNYLQQLRLFGATPVNDERYVESGKIITAAGVSAGIDAALRLVQIIAGDTTARAVQLANEYDPAPPLAAGSPGKVPVEFAAAVGRAMNERAAKWIPQ